MTDQIVLPSSTSAAPDETRRHVKADATDVEIARRACLLPIEEVATRAGLLDEEVEPYGRHKAKISLGFGRSKSATVPSPASAMRSSMISLHSSTHSSQM